MRSSQKSQKSVHDTVPLSNRFSSLSAEPKPQKPQEQPTSGKSEVTPAPKSQISQVVHNLSNIRLTSDEMSLLDKGLNFCPSTKDVNTEELLDDTFSYCRKLRLRHHFNQPPEETGDEPVAEEVNEPSNNDEWCPMKTTFKNPYFDPPSNYSTESREVHSSD